MGKGAIPNFINNLRLGESIVLGNETAYGGRIAGTYNDCFTLCAEIIELKKNHQFLLEKLVWMLSAINQLLWIRCEKKSNIGNRKARC